MSGLKGRERGVKKQTKKAAGHTTIARTAADAVDAGIAHAMDDAPSGTPLLDRSSSQTKDADGNELSAEDIEDQLVEQLAEKRSVTRLAALARLVDKLQATYCDEFVDDRVDTLQLYLLGSIKKGDSSEVALAAKALSLVAITQGPDGEKLVQDAVPTLREYIKNSSKSPAGRAGVAEALAMLTFICGLGDADSREAMSALQDTLQTPSAASAVSAQVPEAVAAAVWDAWGLLASTLPTRVQGEELADATLPQLLKFLDHDSIDVRTAAGENIALLIAARQELQAARAVAAEEEGEEEAPPVSSPIATLDSALNAAHLSDNGAAAGSSQPSSATKKRTRSESNASRRTSVSASSADFLPVLLEKLRDLSTDGNRHRAKKERATQRKSFRDILHAVEDGDVPTEALKIDKTRHEFEGWAHCKQLTAIRNVLGSGLNAHFRANSVLTDIFGLQVESAADEPARKEAQRAQSKLKAKENFDSRSKARKKKEALTNPLAQEE